jgi:putative ABC transport system ATP-binding protein
VEKGQVVAIIGPSGSGKSTLLRCATMLETVDEGEIRYGDAVLVHTDEHSKAVYADKATIKKIRSKFGLVFQNFNLFPHFSVLKNITEAQVIAGVEKKQAQETARALLGKMGLADKENAYPCQLSGGQQQRVSIARALVRNPAVILADEPTGALDSHTGREVIGMLQQLHKEGHTVVLITHDNSIAVQAERIIRLEDGQVVYDGDAHAPEAIVQPTLSGEAAQEEAK